MTEAPATLTAYPLDRPNPFDPPRELQHPLPPLSRLVFPDGHVGWLVTSHRAARAILADNRFSARQELRHSPVDTPLAAEASTPTDPGFFIRMDPPEHTRYRRLLTGQFTVRRMKALEPRITEIVDERLDAMDQAGPPVDLVTEFALPVPSLVICELLGVPYEERGRFQRDTAVVLCRESSHEEVRAALANLYAYFDELAARKLTGTGDDLLSGLAVTGRLSHEELRSIATLLLIAGHETTANMLGLGTFALLRHPDQLAALRADPSLVANAVEELLRFLSIVHIGPIRAALEDVEIEGRRIAAGETVVLSTPAVNRDPSRFENPDTLDITRETAGHLAFGHGVHQCLGQQLARVEMRIGFARLFARFPTLRLAVEPDAIPLRTDMNIYGVHSLPVAW